MARMKIALQYIPNNSTHHAAFKTLRQGLMTNLRDVTTLFSVNARSVVHGEGELVSRVFPSHDEAKGILKPGRMNLTARDVEKVVDGGAREPRRG